MIYFWFPAFESNTQELDISQVNTPWNDYTTPLTEVRTKIILQNPMWVNNYTKDQRIIMKRAMNGKTWTYVTRDRKDADYYSLVLQFPNLRIDRRLALEHFILCAEGKYIGYKDPTGLCHVILITGDVTLPQTSRAGGGAIDIGGDIEKIEDEFSAVDLPIAIIRTYNDITING